VDFRDFGNYDAVIDTSYSPPEAIAAKLAELYQAALAQEPFAQVWLNYQRLASTGEAGTDSGELDHWRQSLREKGFDSRNPLNCLYANESIFLRDGHQRALAASLEGMDLLPCTLTAAAENPA
jgi:hypothetical protein